MLCMPTPTGEAVSGGEYTGKDEACVSGGG